MRWRRWLGLVPVVLPFGFGSTASAGPPSPVVRVDGVVRCSMRLVIIGAGAIGGVLGARLYESGREVLLVARGANHDAIAAHGLTLETPDQRIALPIPVVSSPGAVNFTADDVVLLATKSEDTEAALEALREAAPIATPVVCVQNGVENERVAARRFAGVYGAVVMAPTAHLEPGVVQSYGTTLAGEIDIGRYPNGVDERCHQICGALRAARSARSPGRTSCASSTRS